MKHLLKTWFISDHIHLTTFDLIKGHIELVSDYYLPLDYLVQFKSHYFLIWG